MSRIKVVVVILVILLTVKLVFGNYGVTALVLEERNLALHIGAGWVSIVGMEEKN